MARFRRREVGPLTPSDVSVDRWAHLPAPTDRASEHDEEVPEHGLSRAVWTERDFAQLGWHDATIWAFDVRRADYSDLDARAWPTDRVVLDLDYITRWVQPSRGRQHFTFWVAPCTLVFAGVTELVLDVRPGRIEDLEITDIHAVDGGWHVEGHGIDMKIAATGFTQTFRRIPVHIEGQSLDLAARGGYSYSERPAPI
ncbi:hypothetical protein [Cellulomonas sp. P5_C6]